MPRYSWEGRTATGSVVRGEVDAPTHEAVTENLRAQGLTVTRVDQVGGVARTGAAAGAAPTAPARPGRGLRDTLWTVGVVALFGALGVGAAYIDPVLFYDCARQANGSVDCTVHRRMYGVIPLGDLHVSRIASVDVKSGVHSESMSDRSRRLRLGGQQSSYEILQVASADGSRWESPESTWPLGQTQWDHRAGIQRLLDATSPETYRGWTAEKVTLIIAVVFWAPLGFVLLGLVLRLVMPRSLVEALSAAADEARARRLGRRTSR